MIDKELFPVEYAAIERLKEASLRYEAERNRKREQKLKKIEECRRARHGKKHPV